MADSWEPACPAIRPSSLAYMYRPVIQNLQMLAHRYELAEPASEKQRQSPDTSCITAHDDGKSLI
ncbi:hypothetical protein EMIT047CA2_190050 [Pseudomonas soli]